MDLLRDMVRQKAAQMGSPDDPAYGQVFTMFGTVVRGSLTRQDFQSACPTVVSSRLKTMGSSFKRIDQAIKVTMQRPGVSQ